MKDMENSVNPKRILYEEKLRTDLDFLNMPKIRQADAIEVHRETIDRWAAEVDWDDVRKHVAELYRRQFPEVAAALLKRIRKTGDPKAVELWWARFEEWQQKLALSVEVKQSPLDGMTAQQQGAHFLKHIFWNDMYDSPQSGNVAWHMELLQPKHIEAMESAISLFKQRQAEEAALPTPVIDVQALPEPSQNVESLS